VRTAPLMGLYLADAAILAHRFSMVVVPAIVHELVRAWSLNAPRAGVADTQRTKKKRPPEGGRVKVLQKTLLEDSSNSL
jgi:hypothetical protein